MWRILIPLFILAGSARAAWVPNRATTNRDPATVASFVSQSPLSNAVPGANVTGAVAQAAHATNADTATLATFVSQALLTNQLAASNLISGGQIPISTVITGLTQNAGPMVITNGDGTMGVSYNLGVFTNLPTTAIPGFTNIVTNIIAISPVIRSFNAGIGVTAFDTFEEYSPGVPSPGSMTGGVGWFGAATVSNAFIGTQTFWNGPDQFLALTNGWYERAMTVSNNWNYLRIGISYTIQSNTAAPLKNCILAVGVSSSAGRGYGGFFTGNMSNFLGYVNPVQRTNGNDLNYQANSGKPYWQATDRGVYLWCSPVSNGTNSVAVTTSGLLAAAPFNITPLRRANAILTIPKSGNGMVWYDCAGSTSANQDMEPARMSYTMGSSWGGNQNTISGADLSYLVAGNSGNASANLTESNGNLDTIGVFWSNGTNALQIYSITVRAFF